jgi:ribose/xylose/arabinose/galactoside ABC-type transport system permease subunit
MPSAPRWLFFEFDHPLPAWVFPVVDGLVGGLFLADWCLGRWCLAMGKTTLMAQLTAVFMGF